MLQGDLIHYSGQAWIGTKGCLALELGILRMEETWVSQATGNSPELSAPPTPQYCSCFHFQYPTHLLLVLYPGLQPGLQDSSLGAS